jgi:hypothetical protein
MPKINFDYLNIRLQKRYVNKGFTMKENTGLDTETYQGFVKLLCDDSGRYTEVNNLDDCIRFLTHVRYKGKYNWFYNIQFDFESIIKYLDEIDLRELYTNHEVMYNTFKLTYLPRKYFAIQDKNNNRYYFYDMFNFLDVSLNKASKKFLNDEKIDNIDGNKLNTDMQYWIDNKKEIIKYCIKDAELTKRLADYFWDIIYKNLNFYPKSPMSKGKLSEEYFLHTCKIPAINNIDTKVIHTAYDSFYGGRFEILMRGYMEKCYCYDIKSAYPAEIANLPNFNNGSFVKVDKVSEEAHTGFYKCKVFALEKEFSPFKQKIKNVLNVYPNGAFTQFLTKKEIDFCALHCPNAVINIEFGYEWIPKRLDYPFKTEIERLYQWKDSEKDEDIKYCVKIILNSLYGKFIQISGNDNVTGRLFNPLYASLITSGCRTKILELAIQKPDVIISFSTDSVISTEPLNVPTNPKLGEFQKDFEGQGVFVMSDVYNLWNNETHKVKSRIRGFSVGSTKDYDEKETYLKDILENSDSWQDFKTGCKTPSLYEYFSDRPYHLGECLLHNKKRKITDINVFGKTKKHIDVNGDNKRIWSDEFKTGKDCLKECHTSKPIFIEG